MTTKTSPTLRQGDQVPGHVVVLIGIDSTGAETPFQAQSLDRPFLGFLYPQSAYPSWRCDVLPAEEFKRTYPAIEAR